MEVKELPTNVVVDLNEVAEVHGFRHNRFYREAYAKASRYFARNEVKEEEDFFLLNFALVFEASRQIPEREYDALPLKFKGLFEEGREYFSDSSADYFDYAELSEESQRRAKELANRFIDEVQSCLDDLLDELDEQTTAR